MKLYHLELTEEEVLALRDAVSDFWVAQRRHVMHQQQPSGGAIRRKQVLEALLSNLKTLAAR